MLNDQKAASSEAGAKQEVLSSQGVLDWPVAALVHRIGLNP